MNVASSILLCLQMRPCLQRIPGILSSLFCQAVKRPRDRPSGPSDKTALGLWGLFASSHQALAAVENAELGCEQGFQTWRGAVGTLEGEKGSAHKQRLSWDDSHPGQAAVCPMGPSVGGNVKHLRGR